MWPICHVEITLKGLFSVMFQKVKHHSHEHFICRVCRKTNLKNGFPGDNKGDEEVVVIETGYCMEQSKIFRACQGGST